MAGFFTRALRRLQQRAVTTIFQGVGLTDPRFVRAFSGTMTAAGEHVTVNAALQLSTVASATRRISDGVAGLPLKIYRRQRVTGAREEADGHPLSVIFGESPNADMTSFEFMQATMGRKLLWGNAYSEIIRNGEGAIVALAPLPPATTARRRLESGAIVFDTVKDGFKRTLREEQVWHVKDFSLDGEVGMSRVAQGAMSMGISLAGEKSTASIFKNGLRVPGFITAPEFLDDADRDRAEVMLDRARGSMNAGKIPVLEGGFKFDQANIPPKDAELLASRGFSVEELCRWFDIQPVMVGHTTKANSFGTNLEQTNLQFMQHTLAAHLRAIEDSITKNLLTPAERARGYFAEFSLQGFLRADAAGRAAFYAAGAQNGWMTRNEIRRFENLAPMDGGDQLTVQSNLIPLDRLGDLIDGGDGASSLAAKNVLSHFLGVDDIREQVVRLAIAYQADQRQLQGRQEAGE
ncbi:phage portal protein [Roseomonas mucosa]|uniref:phage portal protein n=1 Tax=Roseomonas mucosa TaxID=207340 RepID=UPI001EF54CCF|nr:phage portal protein [Roseomonas mucosa]MCG7357146.1 phage portal protein [Roseomonas mucosa]